ETYCFWNLSIFLCLFFFSSRRRHTISKRDWSSDVCSSDYDPHVRDCKHLRSPPELFAVAHVRIVQDLSFPHLRRANSAYDIGSSRVESQGRSNPRSWRLN